MFLIILLVSSFLCDTYAASEFANLEVVSDLLPADCFAQTLDYKDADTDGLPKCVKWKKPNTCAQFNKLNSLIYGKMVNKPTCLKDTNLFAAKQCKGERLTGRCFCFDKGGKRIFGQDWWKNADEDMTCACSRKKADMRAEDNPLYFNSLHCNSKGNYEPFQCDVVSEQCWCADEKTGELTSPIVPDKAKTKLPCYDTLTFGNQYLRQCESQKYAQARILYELGLHGTTGGSFAELLCDDDGSYGAYKVLDGSAYCTWRDNTNISPFQVSGNRTGVNCNCARDKIIFKNAGKTQNLECEGNGNYQALQTLGGTPYCVDNDGYRKSPPDATPKSNSDCGSYPAFDG